MALRIVTVLCFSAKQAHGSIGGWIKKTVFLTRRDASVRRAQKGNVFLTGGDDVTQRKVINHANGHQLQPDERAHGIVRRGTWLMQTWGSV